MKSKRSGAFNPATAMADSRPRFQQIQYAFASCVRSPAALELPPGVSNERMDLYRELILNNLRSFLANGFPVIHELLDEPAWQALTQDFLARHRSKAPYFSGIPGEFLAYLRDERPGQPQDPPFLLELAHYEWVELALSIAEEESAADCPELREHPWDVPIVLSPTAWPLVYRYPVHRIRRDHQPIEAPAEATYLTVYRDRDDRVRFLEINAATYRFLELLEASAGAPAEAYLERVAGELGYPDATPLREYFADLLRTLAERGVIGAR